MTFLWLSCDYLLFVTWILIFIYSLLYTINPTTFLKNSIFYVFLIFIFSFFIPPIESTLYFINDNFIYNNFIGILKSFLIFLVLVILIMTLFYIENKTLPIVEYVVLLLISLQGLFIIIIGNDLILTFLGIELQSLCFYILVGFRKNSNLGIEAAFKYFILSSYSNMISLFGVSLIYGFFGTTKLKDIKIIMETSEPNSLLILGVLLLFVAIFFKLAIFLFHYWIGDVYQGALLIVTSIFAIIPKIVYVFFFFKLYLIFFFFIKDVSILIALFSIVFGTLISIYQTSFRRMIAFSSLTHIGYIIMGISLNTIDGFVSSFFYIFFYIIMLIFSFCFVLIFVEKENYIDDLSAFGIIARNHFLTAVLFSTILLSMAGVPFMAGFYSKFYFFLALYSSGNFFLTFFILLISVASSIYYLSLFAFFYL